MILVELSAHEEAGHLGPPSSVRATDAVGVARGLVIHGLASQGLALVDLGAMPVARDLRRATVRVVATHAGPGGSLHTAVYELDLIRQVRGTWRLTTHRVLQ